RINRTPIHSSKADSMGTRATRIPIRNSQGSPGARAVKASMAARTPRSSKVGNMAARVVKVNMAARIPTRNSKVGNTAMRGVKASMAVRTTRNSKVGNRAARVVKANLVVRTPTLNSKGSPAVREVRVNMGTKIPREGTNTETEIAKKATSGI